MSSHFVQETPQRVVYGRAHKHEGCTSFQTKVLWVCLSDSTWSCETSRNHNTVPPSRRVVSFHHDIMSFSTTFFCSPLPFRYIMSFSTTFFCSPLPFRDIMSFSTTFFCSPLPFRYIMSFSTTFFCSPLPFRDIMSFSTTFFCSPLPFQDISSHLLSISISTILFTYYHQLLLSMLSL